MERRDRSEGIAGTGSTPPPLPERRDVGVVEGHLGIEPPDCPPLLPKSDAEFGLLAGDQRAVVEPGVPQSRHAHEDVATAFTRRPRTAAPFAIAHCVVDRSFRKALSAAAEDDRDV